MVQIEAWIRKNVHGDPVIWFIVFVLSVFGVLVVYSAAASYGDGDTSKTLFKHLFLIGLSLYAMWMAHNLHYQYYSKLSRVALLLSVILLIVTFFFGKSVHNANRWLEIPLIGQTFQPSDLAKLALISNLAAMLAKRQKNIDDFSRSLKPILIWCGLICGLIALSDLSTALQLFTTCMVVMFIGRVPMKQLGLLLVSGLGMVFLALYVGQRWETAVSRVKEWFGTATGSITPDQMEPQIRQAYNAVANGGLTGNGLGKSIQDDPIFLEFSDYIFAKINNDLGSIVSILLVFLYLALLYRGMKVAAKSEGAFGGLLSAGLSFALVIQAIVHMAVNVGLAPATGVPLPMVSMGGTSLLFTGLALGIILSVSRGEAESPNSVKETNDEE